MRRVGVLQHQTGAQYSAVEYTKERAEMRNVLVPAPHPDPVCCLNGATRMQSYLRKASRW